MAADERRRVGLCVDPGEGTVRLVCAAQREAIIQHDLPALIDRVYDQVQAPVVLIWDNCISHTTRWLQDELAARAWLRVVHLPKYGPELNLVETLWSHVKTSLANRAFRSVDELEKVMRSPLRSV